MTVLDPAPIRHQHVIDRGMKELRRYADSTLDGWQITGEKNGVKLYSRKPDIPHSPMIYRGDFYYAGDLMMNNNVRPLDISTAFTLHSIRKFVDSRLGASDVRVIRSRYSVMSYVQSLSSWPIGSRDFSQVNHREFDDNVAYFGSFSVVDDDINPPVPGYIRAHTTCSGIKVSRDTIDGGWMFTLITQLNPGGFIPTMIVHRSLQTLPASIHRYGDYFDRFGFPPTATLGDDDNIEFLGEDFDHSTTLYTLHLGCKVESGGVEIKCCDRMFPKGFKVEIQGKGQYRMVELKPHKVIQLGRLMGSVTVLVSGHLQHGPLHSKN
ncbi:hypothetical protein BC941DRAFT_474615 [Chlamydoabsidia padenii]|nr:hypothetical protein BC941DRAFT_474615 [Chlamydoabsidia padenii]